ncbi:hypothetical protein F5884DRAFT_897324 [Xylogone sp. PMI_703]|nr:hypothetical protein F5884DRAFT_897324 [Xylogone sp. PMI_703]
MDIRTLLMDVAVVSTAFASTHVLFKLTKQRLMNGVPSWNNIRTPVQNRMSCELALLPIRFVLFLCCAPAILGAFAPKDVWTRLDTERTTIACAIMAGSYAYDLTIERADVLSLIHHCMGPAMLIWIRLCFATYTPADALMNRLLVSFVFFGAGVGGSVTTSMLLMMKLMKPHISAQTLHLTVSLLSWVLTVNTYISTMYGSLYILFWVEDLAQYWGHYCFIPLVLATFEFYLQWRWALRFQTIADELQTAAGWSVETKNAGFFNLSKRLSQKDLSLGVMVVSWAISYFGVYVLAFQKTVIRPILM